MECVIRQEMLTLINHKAYRVVRTREKISLNLEFIPAVTFFGEVIHMFK